ncbi:hypothetical protein D8674_017088 [Pyrus ussuriensis x Pyrus communis]|uniref:DUF1677 family protein n=3 Tax=Maleae TaxID=721813 RepID=A0A5N5HCS5_9ROSA|nr:hypothetical protein D8674_017088 [Pyrus ussuriensis x Pyrus communis]
MKQPSEQHISIEKTNEKKSHFLPHHCNPIQQIKTSHFSLESLHNSSELCYSAKQKTKEKRKRMEIEMVRCECCGLKEDCTQDYITQVKAKFDGKWLCGLCSEAVRDEVGKGSKQPFGMEEAVRAHMSFCGKFKSNPAVRVADGMRQMLRRRSDMSSSSSSPKKYTRSASTSQVGDSSSFS